MVTQTSRSPLSFRREDIPMSDKDIIGRYLGITKFPCKLSSPLREDDDRPSFSMREKGDTVLWKDFGTGEGGNAITLMAKLWNVTYSEALLKIKLDSDSRVPKIALMRRYKGELKITQESTLRVKIRPWKDWDREFWESFGITEQFATWCNVHPISHAFFTVKMENGSKRTVTVPMDKYAYAYFEWKDQKESIKLYQPYSRNMKWLSKHDASVWDLWKQAMLFAQRRNNDAVILTSSRKDAMCLWNNLGVPAMSLQGEGYIPKPHVMKEVFGTFKHVYLWYDNDYTKQENPGQTNAAKLCQMFPGLHNICIPSSYESKDPSDLYKNKGIDALREVWYWGQCPIDINKLLK